MVKRTDRPAMTIAVDMGRKATKTNKQIQVIINIKLEINELIFLRRTADNVICSGHLHENKLYMLSREMVDTKHFITNQS